MQPMPPEKERAMLAAPKPVKIAAGARGVGEICGARACSTCGGGKSGDSPARKGWAPILRRDMGVLCGGVVFWMERGDRSGGAWMLVFGLFFCLYFDLVFVILFYELALPEASLNSFVWCAYLTPISSSHPLHGSW